MTKISKYITLDDACKSVVATRKGIDNSPTTNQILAITKTATLIHEPISDKLLGGRSCPFSSFFRSKILNKEIGGATGSQHCTGEAIDLDLDNSGLPITNKQLFDWILKNLDFDQLIWEFGDDKNPAWVHVSISFSGKNRKEVLRAIKKNGKTRYVPL